MHRTPQLISPARVLAFLLSLGLHGLLIRQSLPAFRVPRIEFEQGQSAMLLTLTPAPEIPPEPEPSKPEPIPVEKKENPPLPEVSEPAEFKSPPPEPRTPISEPPPEPQPLNPEPSPEPQIPSPEPSVVQDASLEDKGVLQPAIAPGISRPVYPRISRRRGEEGTVVIAVTVLPDGRGANPRIRQSSGFSRLDNAALEAVRKTRFQPARRNGLAITSDFEQVFIFRLEDK
jgi:periplasmic protein TonB